MMYADDTAIVFSHTDFKQIEQVLNSELGKVKSWLDKHKLTLNTKKTKYMIFGTEKRLHKVRKMSIAIGGEELERVKTFKYLGVHLDEAMTYKEHISKVVKKISSRIGAVSRVVKYISLDHRKMLFNAIILPHFDYCSQVWSNASKTTLDTLVKLQKRGGRMLVGAPKRTPTVEVFRELKWTSITTRWQQQKLAMVYRVSKDDGPEYMKDYFTEVNDTHKYETRMATNGSYTLPKVSNDSGKRTFKYSGAREWNLLPESIRKSEARTIFRARCNRFIR